MVYTAALHRSLLPHPCQSLEALGYRDGWPLPHLLGLKACTTKPLGFFFFLRECFEIRTEITTKIDQKTNSVEGHVIVYWTEQGVTSAAPENQHRGRDEK